MSDSNNDSVRLLLETVASQAQTIRAQAETIRHLLGQPQADELHFVPLPKPLVEQVEAYWAAEFKL